jgi:hypothetical protein
MTLIENFDLPQAYLKLITSIPPGYRCLLTSGNELQAIQSYDCFDDAEAILKVTDMLGSKPAYWGAEIWRGNRLVARIPGREHLRRIVPRVTMPCA